VQRLPHLPPPLLQPLLSWPLYLLPLPLPLLLQLPRPLPLLPLP
jgi:hypothetical protein